MSSAPPQAGQIAAGFRAATQINADHFETTVPDPYGTTVTVTAMCDVPPDAWEPVVEYMARNDYHAPDAAPTEQPREAIPTDDTVTSVTFHGHPADE